MTLSPAGQQVYEDALDWVTAHLDSFHPDHPHVADHQLRVKPFIELVFVLNPFVRRGLHHADPRLRRILDFVARTFDSYDFAAFAQQDPAGLIVFALRDEFLRLCGRPRAADALLARWIASGLPDVVVRSRTPYRVMDLLYSLNRAEGTACTDRYLRHFPGTVLARGKPVARCTDSDLYSMTHTLFYLSDLGARPLDGALLGSRLQERLVAALGLTLRQKNADLAGEFLMCLGFLGLHRSPPANLAWQILRGLQQPDGAMPAPNYDVHKKYVQDGLYHFTQCYHTTLVMLGAALPVVQDQTRAA